MRDNLKKLQTEWYAKLKQAGFKDIEYFEEKHDRLEPKPHVLKTNSIPQGVDSRKMEVFAHDELVTDARFSAGKETFFILARRFTYTHQFEDATQKEMWRLYAEGYSAQSIINQLKLTQSRRTIARKLQNLKDIMLKTKFLTDEEHWNVKS